MKHISIFIKYSIRLGLLAAIIFLSPCSRSPKGPLIEQYTYDSQGKLIFKTAPDGGKIEFKYNDQGLLTEIRYPGGYVRCGYEKNGNRAWMKDRTGTTRYYYDAFNRLVGVIWKHHLLRVIAYEYNPWGYVSSISIFNPKGLEDNLKYRKFLDEHDQAYRQNPKNWQASRSIFNEMMQRLKQEQVTQKEKMLEYEVKYDYNLLGNLKHIHTQQGTVNYFYKPEKGEIKRQLPNGITTYFTYSPLGLLKSLYHESRTGQLISKYQYEYNAAGKVIQAHELTAEGTKTTTYVWDQRGYLKELHLPDRNKIYYEYDAMGNRMIRQDLKSKLQYNYDKFGMLAQAGDSIYKWNRNGSLVSEKEGKFTTRFRYDGRDLPIIVRIPGATIRYEWDGNGEMFSKRIGKDITYYLSNPLAPTGFTLAEFNRTNQLTASYLYGDVLLGQQDINGKMRYFLEDGFNSIRHITDTNGKIVGKRDYTPFADPITIEGDIAGNFRCAGEKFHSEIKKYFIENRLYDPCDGRYLSPDPEPGYLERFDSFNRYTHGSPDPDDFMEPRCNKSQNTNSQPWWSLDRILIPIFDKLYKKIADSVSVDVPGVGKVPYFAGAKAFIAEGEIIGNISPKEADRLRGQVEAKAGAAILMGVLGKEAYDALPKPQNIGKALVGVKQYYPIPYLIGKLLSPRYQGKSFTDLAVEEAKSLLESAKKKLYGNENQRQLKSDRDKPFKGPDWPDDGGGGGGSITGGGIGSIIGGGGGLFSGGFNDPFKSVENQLGGIELSATGEFIGNPGKITAAVYDSEKQCLVLLGDKNLSAPSIKAEDLAVALMSVFGPRPYDPQFSLDPADPRKPKGKWLKAVYIPEEFIEGTSFGKTLFEADWLLKQYAFGVCIDENGMLKEREFSLPGLKSTADLSLEEKNKTYGQESWARFWIVSDKMILKEYGNSIHFDAAKMKVKAKKQVPDPSSPTGLRDVDTRDDPIALKFANQFTQLYDEIAKESPDFERVRELAKAVALAKWLKKEGIPIDMDWVVKYANKRIKSVSQITALSIEKQRQYQKPYSNTKGRPIGIQTITEKIYLFGGVDLTVNPKYVSDDGLARSLQETVRSKLSQNQGPIFTIYHNGNTFQAFVLPVTKNGQKIWENSPSVEIDGIIYQFNNIREVSKSIDTKGNTAEYYYDSNRKLKKVKISNTNGWKISGERNPYGSNWTTTDPPGNTIKYKYGSSGYLNAIEVNDQNWATYKFDPNQQKMMIKYDGYTEKMTYDKSGNIQDYEILTGKSTSASVSETEKILFDYDKFGNLTKIGGIGAPAINISYSEKGDKPTKITLPQAEIQYAYWPDGRIKEESHSGGMTAYYFYENNNLSRLQVYSQDKRAEYLFNEDGIVQSKDFLGGKMIYDYHNGKLSSVSQDQFGEAKYVYDAENRLAEIHFPNGTWFEYKYEEEKRRGNKSENSPKQILTMITHPASIND
jgi:YD repeat-containing protein